MGTVNGRLNGRLSALERDIDAIFQRRCPHCLGLLPDPPGVTVAERVNCLFALFETVLKREREQDREGDPPPWAA